MSYFKETDGAPERIGKVLGDVFAAFVVVALIVIFTQNAIFS